MSRATYTLTSPPTPGLTPPPGVIPNFQEPYTLQPYVTLVISACIVSTTIVVAARMLVKFWIVKKLLWEDWTCVLGWLCFLIFLAFEWATGNHGAGAHQWNVSFEAVQYDLRISNYGDMFYCISILSVKLSILLLILRIFLSVDRDIFFWITHLLIMVNSIFYIISFFVAIFLCSPREKIWNPDMPGTCLDNKTLYIFSAGFNVASDITMISVPIYLIWTLQMSTKRKIGVSAIFGTGAFACISSLLRVIYQVKLNRTQDYTYVKTETGLWGYAELACGIICGSLPILPLLWQHLPHRSRDTGRISLAPVNNYNQANGTGNQATYSPGKVARSWDDAYEASQQANGDWVKLEEGAAAPLPKSYIERESDEQAINDAIIGGNEVEGTAKKAKNLSMRISEHMAGKTGHER